MVTNNKEMSFPSSIVNDRTPSSGEVRLSPSDSLTFIQEAEARNWAVIGVEGGRVLGEAFEPDTSMILDLSNTDDVITWEEIRERNNHESTTFISTAVGHEEIEFYITYVDKYRFSELRQSNT